MTISENASVKLKGVGDSLWITVDCDTSLQEIKDELIRIFSRMQSLAEGARVVLDGGTLEKSHELVAMFGYFLKDRFKVGEVENPPAGKNEAFRRVRSRDVAREWSHRNSDVLMMSGRVRSGQKITAKKHLVLMGDVNPGAELSAGGDIIVMGRLYGSAFAGLPDNASALITALDFKPSRIQIGNVFSAGVSKLPGGKAEMARNIDGRIVVEDYLKTNPFGRIPWPEVR